MTTDPAGPAYQDLIFEHASRPRGRGALPPPAAAATCRNQLCGDAATFYLGWRAGGGAALGFETDGCALCRASASVLATAGAGLSAAALAVLVGTFLASFAPPGAPLVPPPAGLPPAVEALYDLRRYPSRERCVLLPWEALAQLLLPPREGA